VLPLHQSPAQTRAAADDSAPLAEVVVTGSNIRRVDSETASPIQIVSQEESQRTGKTTLAEYLQTLTAGGQGAVMKTFGTGFAAGGAGVSLRGLGAGSTLVLLNGRRIAPYGLADDGQKVFTDLSVIPLETVERVEVLNCIGTPKTRINFGATWEMPKFSVSTLVNFIGSFKNVNFAGAPCASIAADGSNFPNEDCRIPSFYSVDLSGRWSPTEAMEAFGTIENVLDRQAPLDPRTYGAVDYNPLHAAGAIGRYYTVGLRYRFD
jgi:outer membrane receptor protein involved in Fe transport